MVEVKIVNLSIPVPVVPLWVFPILVMGGAVVFLVMWYIWVRYYMPFGA